MPKTCPQCQNVANDDAAFCPRCGASLSAEAAAATPTGPAPGAAAGPSTATGPSPGASTPSPSAARAGGSSVPPYRFEAARLLPADWIAGIATVVLFISLFLAWFGVSIIGVTITASGVSAHGFLYIVMILCLLEVAYLVLRAGWGEIPGLNVPHLTVMLVVTLVNLVLVFIAFVDKPGGSGVGWQFGAFLALVAGVVAAAPYAVPQLRSKTM